MVEEISPEELKAELENGGVQLVDIRDEDAYADGHIPGADNLPLDDFADLVDEREWGDEIVVTCYVGESSIQAARLLEAYEGVEEDAFVASVAGGYEEWDGELTAE